MRYPHSNKLLHLACLATSLISAPLHADILEVAGAPPFTSSTNTGFKGDMVAIHPGQGVNNTGTAVAFADKYTAGTLVGMRSLRWNAAGGFELGTLGDNGSGVTTSHPYAINNPGVAVGYAYVFSGATFNGYRAVRWDAGSTAATALGNLGLSASGGTLAQAIAINDAGTTVGYASKMSSTFNFGFRAVRWDAGTTVATELGNLAASATGSSDTQAFAINASGTAVGLGDKFIGPADKGSRAIRWDAGSTLATELDALGTNLSGVTESTAYAINAAGTAVGEANKYSGNTSLGARAVRWDAGTTAAVELATLGTNLSGFTDARAYAVNASGMAAGLANKYSGNGNLGTRAVR
ncbi:MAG TPA: hypothetical protein VHM90_11185 [Phycisphaerae bacterium]|nr:hypothetical protein [Phycisphaerae bacterium]